ncbi:MAG: 23S rRNA (pseudouridine(1915)-N(3))-methyltransferase RlmH [Clostridia bacterium]|nr:23S rRNA (pseudouridine(1915)-N(3))-methyltransferase RlmH [Clostridia bacterium]MBQ8925885.1 23S rRNA (pseudouridine(1915)-N(3))-methyltransferase RlmH [Clostridia bacterium]
MNVTLIVPGKLKEKYLQGAQDEYRKRLTAFCKLNIIEVSVERLPSEPSDAEIAAALDKEGKRILASVPKDSYTYALCIEGKQRTSVAFSSELDRLAVSGTSHVTFVIGSSFGLSDEVKQFADASLSMSEMTFPHQLARIMLLEQLYRAFQISSGGKYHK